MPFSLGRKIRLWQLWQRQLSQLVLYYRFPDRHRAQINCIVWVTDGFFDRSGQPTVTADKPEKDMSVEQKIHLPSNSCKIASGNGASKSSGTTNSPAHSP